MSPTGWKIKTCFGDKAGTILDNIGTQQYYAINSYDTADALSKRAGDMTIQIASDTDGDSDSQPTGFSPQPQGGNRSRTKSRTYSEIARRVIKPEEILTLDERTCMIFHKNLPLTFGSQCRYYEAPEFRNGGTAAPRRLGLAAAVMAGFTLAASTLFAAVALGVSTMAYRPPLGGRVQAMHRPAAVAQQSRLDGHIRQVPPSRQIQQKYPKRRRPGPSGYLIKIQ